MIQTRRGDVVVGADRDGDYTSKPRPSIVIQSDLFPTSHSVTLCPLTSIGGAFQAVRVPIQPTADLPLEQASWAQADKITTVRRSRIARVIGRVTPEEMRRVEDAISLFLGMT